MSHNINEIKSQHELNDGKRKSDVLIEAIEKCERLEEALKLATDALKYYADESRWRNIYDDEAPGFEPIYRKKQFRTEYGYRKARETLEKIEQLGQVEKENTNDKYN